MRRSIRNAIGLVFSLSWSFSLAIALPSAAEEDPWPRLDSPGALQDVLSYRAVGSDPGGPRPLVLWRWDGAHFIRLASTRSNSNGRFDFGEQALPSGDAYFHVAIRNEIARTDRLLRIERPVPAPVIVSGGLGSGELTFAPARRGGEIRIYDATSNRLILRKPVEVPVGTPVSLDLMAELPRPWPTALSFIQVLDDGRRSDRGYWPLDE